MDLANLMTFTNSVFLLYPRPSIISRFLGPACLVCVYPGVRPFLVHVFGVGFKHFNEIEFFLLSGKIVTSFTSQETLPVILVAPFMAQTS